MSNEQFDLDLDSAIDLAAVPDDLKKALCETWSPFRKVLDELVKHYVKGEFVKIFLIGAMKILDILATTWCKPEKQ